ncbi:MAG: deoxynucleoside kinase [Anaerolineae bacterium]|nr:deoxynucleoside kinase [Anaerolineae bacterium]
MPGRDKRFIAIAGNIGVGKSTLTGLMAQRLDWKPFFEAVDDNPYLADFYADMSRGPLGVLSLAAAPTTPTRRISITRPTLQDRSVCRRAEVFAANLYRQGWMSQRDYATYAVLYEGINLFLPPPT